jgi:hypothetical protein
MTLESVRVFQVPWPLIRVSETALKQAGDSGYELFVLWTGKLLDDTFEVQHTYVPTQQSYRRDKRVHVRVDGEELHKLNRWLYEQRQVLGVQVHTHPDDAYHSDTDNTYPIATTLGSLSIVVPNFAREGLVCPGMKVYRLASAGWVEVSVADVQTLVRAVS